MMKIVEWYSSVYDVLAIYPIFSSELLLADTNRDQWCSQLENRASIPVALISIFFVFGVSLVCVKRRRTKTFLEQCGLPTVYWTPRFMKYRAFEDKKFLNSSSITKILPKMKQHGGPYGMFGTVYGITTPVIHVAHPVPAKAILTGRKIGHVKGASRRPSISLAHSTATSKAPAYNHFKNFFGEGVFTADGEDWKAKRTAIMHCLIKGTSSSLSEVFDKLENEANRAASSFCYQVRALQQNNFTGHCDQRRIATANVVPLLQRSTIGFIYRYITHSDPKWLLPANMVCNADDDSDGEDLGCDNSEGTSSESVSLASSPDESIKKINEAEEDVSSTSLPSSMLNTYLSSVLRIRMITMATSRSIWFLLPQWCYRLFSSLYRDEERTLEPIREFAKTACEDALPQSPLSQLSEWGGPYKSKVIPNSREKSPSSVGRTFNKNLLCEATTILFAGQDTSAATLSWTLHLLSLYPNVQERLAKEVREHLDADEDFGRSADYRITRKVISRLPYLDAVIKESMRLYPVAPFIVRRLQEDLSIPKENNDGIISLPSGSLALVWLYSLHRNPEFWNNPDEFIPERWIDVDLKDPGQSNGAYMPFASGPRNCLGQPIAHIVIRTMLARLVYQFQFADSRSHAKGSTEEMRIEMEAGFTVLPTGGVHLQIRNRASEKD
jgi:cytochrome P450